MGFIPTNRPGLCHQANDSLTTNESRSVSPNHFTANFVNGDKGVICKILPDEHMPVDAAGNRAELIMDPHARSAKALPSTFTKKHPHIIRHFMGWSTTPPEKIQRTINAYKQHKMAGTVDWEGGFTHFARCIEMTYKYRHTHGPAKAK